MKAELTNGITIELTKDCECLTHEGPHWLHADRLWQAMNLELLKPENSRAWDEFCKEDLARLRVKYIEMGRQGIKRIIESEAK